MEHELGGEKAAARQGYHAARLYHPAVFGEEDIEVDDGVPFVLGGPVGQIAEHHVYRFVGDGLDLLKAVAFDDGVEKRLN